MHVTRNLGFSSFVLLLCLLVPVIWFVIRRKWRAAAARSEEIKRLLIFASEEAARAEFEATVSYNSFSVANKNQCAVCYCPTSTRCAQCKAIRYCSGKCQIIHWRQGHKEECRPASITYSREDGVGDFSEEAAKLGQPVINGNKSAIEGESYAKSIDEPSENCLSSDDETNSETSCGLDGNIEVKPLEETKRSHSACEMSTSTYSGFSSSNNSSESSDDASVSETNTLHHLEQPDGNALLDSAFGILDTNYEVDIIDKTMSNSPKFTRLVDSVGGLTKLNTLNGTGSKGVSNHAPNGYSDLHVHVHTAAEPSKLSSGHCSDTLDLDSNGCNSSRKSISVASPLYSYKASPASHAQATGADMSELDGTCLNSAANSKPFTETASEIVRSSRIMDSLAANDVHEGPILTNDGTTNSSHKLEIKEDKSVPSKSTRVHLSFKRDEDSSCTISSGGNGSQLRSSKRSNYVGNDQSCVSFPANSSEVSGASHEGGFICGTETHLIHNDRCGENGIQSAISTSQAPTPSLSYENGLKASVSKVVDQLKGSKSLKYHPSMVGIETPGRYKDKGLFPYDLFVKLHIWNKVQLQPCGLINCGNSCYANVVLQCLAFTPPLTAYFLQKLHSKACIKEECCFTCKLESLILKANEGKSPLSPKGILSLLQSTGCQLGNGREEDAHEFLRHAIDTMQSICLMEAGIKASSSPEEDTTLVGLTFGGYLRSKIKCSKCGGKSERQERMMDLTVEIEGDILTLEEALERFTSTETLDGENKYHCVRCKSYEKAKKKLTVLEAPNVLTIALKRFQSGKFGKLNKPIRFPEILDLAPFMSGTSDNSPIYRLYAVVVHLDIMNAAFSGHYVCYAKNMKNKWFKMDDSLVTPVELESVLTKGAYMLFYARCSPRAPRLIRNRIISSEPKIKVIPPWISGKNTTTRSVSFTSPASTDSSVTLESFYSKFQHVRRILEEDTSSDNSSLISNNSDEGSCSTDSTRDSSSTEDFSDYIFGDLGRGWNRNPDSDASSSSSPMCSTSSSPLYSRHSPLANLERYASRSTEATDPQSRSLLGAGIDGNASPSTKLPGEGRKLVYSESEDGVSLVHSEATKNYSNIASGRSSNGISFRETVEERLEYNSCNDPKSDVFFRTSTRTN